MISQTKITKRCSTPIPVEMRKAMGIEPGDALAWKLKGKEMRVSKVSPKKKTRLKDIIGLISKGGNALESKKEIQRGIK